MKTLFPHGASDDDLVRFVDQWASLMESEDYAAAYEFTSHDPYKKWTPALMQEVVKAYGESSPSQKVTLQGIPTDITQRKEVTRWPKNQYGAVGEIWYDLNINGMVSDLTATFTIIESESGLRIELNDIHVM
jgi:hypothetical protein